VYIGSMDGSFRCLSAESGDELWRRAGASISAGAAADAAGRIIYGDEAGVMRAVDAKTGAEIWSRDFDGKVVAPPAVFGDRIVAGIMVPSALKPPKRPYVICMAADSGEILWQKIDSESLLHTPTGDGERIFFATVSGYTSTPKMFALRLSDGEQLWQRNLGGVADCSPALSPTRLVFGNHDESFHVWTQAGREVAAVQIGAKLFSSPAVVESGIYFGTGDGRLICLRSLADAEAGED
jgi:outer membrane protein assembly factor BamB